MDTICVEAVTGRTQGSWYDEYRRLRHRVFVVEQGWTGLSAGVDEATIPDPADARARFWLARSRSGALVGAVRIRTVRDTFHHEDLFRHHLRRREMAAMRPWMGTLNSLVVDREWRSRLCATPSRDEGTVASMLLRTSLSDSAGTDFRALVATAQTLISARALMRVGFRVIDPPIRTHLHARFAMCNVGVVLTTDDLCARALSTYFEECQRRVLKESSLADWFSAPLAIPNLPRAI